MKKFLKSLTGKFTAVVVGLGLAAGLAVAANSFYAGFQPQAVQTGIVGTIVSGGPVPTSGASTSCGTLGAITGGTSAGTIVTAAVTTCTVQLVLPVSSLVVSSGNNDGLNATNSSAVPNKVICLFIDLTHPAIYGSASATTTSCTSSALTITAGDTLEYVVLGS